MRINKFIAQVTGLSRRAADTAIIEGRVMVNGQPPQTGQSLVAGDVVTADGRDYRYVESVTGDKLTIILNKPAGYVVSRDGQGSKTVYGLLPPEYHHLKPVGRLDKDSSGLLLLTNDGDLANQLTHPRYAKTKVYEITLDQQLQPLHCQMISDHGISLDDGISKLGLERLIEGDDRQWRVTMQEGRNRQIRRTFAALGYTVVRLHRTHFGEYQLDGLPIAKIRRAQ